MKRAWLLLLVIAALGPLVGPARADTTGVQLGVAGPAVSGKVLSEIRIPARFHGGLVVSFRGDVAAGCATYGLCSYSGTIVVRPTDDDVYVTTVRRDGRIHHVVTLQLGSDPTGYITSTRVQRAVPGGPGATCADVASSLLAADTTGVIRGATVTLGVLDKSGSLLRTRCAGPTDGDLSNVGPTAAIPLARLRRGRVVVDLSASHTFATHGFAGTIDSTLTMRLGKPRSDRETSAGFPPGTTIHRTRLVTEHLTLVRVRGRLSAAVRGTGNPTVCGLLDSCGLTGTLSMSDVVLNASAQVIAVGPARRPYRDFLAALGLSRSGRSRGISVALEVSWAGAVRATLNQAGATCTDMAPTGGVAFESGSGLGGGAFSSSWRTHCPGPIFSPESQALSASFKRTALRHREFSVGVQAKGSLTDDGYVIVPHGRLSMLLRRGRVAQQVIAEPGG